MCAYFGGPVRLENKKENRKDRRGVLVGAHEHNDAIWWTWLLNPLENLVGSRNLEGVIVRPLNRPLPTFYGL